MTGKPAPGTLLKIDQRASAQFAGQPGFTFRVISVCDKLTYQGWAWITGYVLDQHGQATEKREIFVRLAGLNAIQSDRSPTRTTSRPNHR